MDLCVNYHPLKKEASLTRIEWYIDLWIQQYVIMLEVILLLCLFSSIIVLGFALGPMTYLFSGSWPLWNVP